jgi:hypothetical protein
MRQVHVPDVISDADVGFKQRIARLVARAGGTVFIP